MEHRYERRHEPKLFPKFTGESANVICGRRCIRDTAIESRQARGQLLTDLVGSIDDIVQRMYANKRNLTPTTLKDAVSSDDKAKQLIDLCYMVITIIQ